MNILVPNAFVTEVHDAKKEEYGSLYSIKDLESLIEKEGFDTN